MRKIIFIFCCLALLCTTSSHAQEWDSSFQEFEFGKVRILSCFTGIKRQQKLYAGIHILPDQDWIIQDPNLTWTASDDSVGKGFIPFTQPLQNEILYPAIFWLKQNEQNTTYSAQGIIRACHIQNGCKDFSIQLAITLPPQTALQTPQCIAVLSALAQIPKPWPNLIRGQAIASSSEIAHVTLQLPQTKKTIKLFHFDKTPLIPRNIQYEPFSITFDLPTQNNNDLNFLLQTPSEIYEIKLPIQDKSSSKIPLKLPPGEWLKLLLFSLIFSPLFMVWGCNNQTSVRTCKKFNHYICISIGLATLTGLCCACFPNLWVTQPLNKYLSVALIIATLLWGKSSPFLIFLALLLIPKPLWNNLQIASTGHRIIFILTLSFIWLIAFGWQIKYADKIHLFFKKWHKLTPHGLRASFSLFLFLLLCYTIFYL